MSRTTVVSLVMAILLVVPGCRMVKMKLGLGESITNPDPGTPERVIQQVLKAALNPDKDAGWEAFEALLHSEETSSNLALQEWSETKFDTIRRKAAFLVKDQKTVAYQMMDFREDDKGVQIFVKSSASEMPTPCRLRPDPAAGGAWRVFNACF